MGSINLQIIESVIVLIGFALTLATLRRVIDRAGAKFAYQRTRVRIVKKVVAFILYAILIGLLLSVWGVDRSELAFYVGSLLTVLGIAFFAQWSVISNITSTLIIFFYHQVNIGDSIVVLDKEYNIEGEIMDIGIFFIIIKVSDGAYVSLPSNVFMQKMVKKKRKEENV